ncbi:MAG: hypothetical protein AAFP70_03530 [Calditrichota bacterium]
MKNPFVRRSSRDQEFERRNLVGRRYEDYINNDIKINLASEEHSWRLVITDPRYKSLLNRRKNPRRTAERPPRHYYSLFKPNCSFMFMRDPFDEEGYSNT